MTAGIPADRAAGAALREGADVAPPRALRTSVATALAVVLSDPALWLLGAAGFLVRGGWLLLVLPIWSLPSPVAITTLLGADALGTGRLTPQLLGLIAAALAAFGATLVASAAAAAAVEVAAFEHFVCDPETLELRRGREARQLPGGERSRLIVRLVALSGLLLLPAGAALVATALRMIEAVYQEFLLPGSLDVPLALRIVASSLAPLFVLVLCLLGAEVLWSVMSRQLMAARVDPGSSLGAQHDTAYGPLRGAPRTLLRQPLRSAATALLAWLATLCLVLPAVGAVLVGWAAVRSAFLGSGALRDPQAAAAAGLVSVLFVALWCGALLLAGLASAFRAALWSAESIA